MTRIAFRAAASTLLVVSLSACGDAPTDPNALIVAEHARAALDVSVPLPSLADAERMDPVEFDGVLRDLGVWLDAAEARLEANAPSIQGIDALRAEVAEGRARVEEARGLEAEGERDAAIASLIGAEAHLLRTTTYAVAERRIAAAAAVEAHCPARPGPADALPVARGRRLLAHAREAIADGDAERALQRAHYAVALLTGPCRQGAPQEALP